MTSSADILIWQDGPLGRLRLNRPRALNALTHDMIKEITAALLAWETDDTITAIVLDAEGDRAFCAGGDIRSLCELGRTDIATARQFLFDEYQLNAMIAHYAKPYIALMDGLTIGGGIGVTSHGSHRIVTERTSIAMPESTIGFLPDIGGTYLLSRAPGHIGEYLGVTGTQVNGADAIYAGFADTFVAHDNLPELVEALRDGVSPDAAVNRLAGTAEASNLAALQVKIDDAFGRTNVVECEKRLQDMSALGDEWAGKTLHIMSRNAPLSMVASFVAINNARNLDTLEACIAAEYRFVYRTLEGHDLYEGVRAILVDKDRNPKWEFVSLEDVPQSRIAAEFAPLGKDEWRAR